jgi:calcyclin binding protein
MKHPQVEFSSSGFILRIHNLKGRFYKLSIGPVHEEIDKAASLFRLRSKGVTVVLKKREAKMWNRLLEDKNAKRTKPSLDKDADPSQSLMTMMKDLYDQGDEDTKRMMNKAWV